jgi:signal transduction histidine kinase
MEPIVHQVNQVDADRRQWHERDFKRSVDFHAVLLAMAGHDLRQHLQVILGTYGWLSRRVIGAPEHEQIERGQRAVAQMAEQLRQLISALRLHQETGRIERVPVRLGPLFSTLGQNAAELALQQRVELRVVPTQAVVASDPVLLGSVLENLLRNAVKFTASGGRILLGLRRCGRFIRIEVHDTGIGIPSERLVKIFDAFQRLDPTLSDGLGLGLFVVSRAVELLQHQIEVQSALGRGSCFAISAQAWEKPSATNRSFAI